MGCDGTFDQMSNQEVMECAWMILNNDTNNNKKNEEGIMMKKILSIISKMLISMKNVD